MAQKSKQDGKGKKGSGRTTALAGLLAVVAVIAAWLSNCIPGFGIGSEGQSEGEAEDSEKAAPAAKEDKTEAEAAPDEAETPAKEDGQGEAEAAANKTLAVMVSAQGCVVPGSAGASAPIDCATLCEQAELFEGIDDAILEVDGASHGSVVAVTDCLKQKGIDKVAIRRE